MNNEVIEFISRRWTLDSHFTDGNCYWFALILTIRFPYLQLYYLPIIGHFIAGDGEKFYDFNGLYTLDESPYPFTQLMNNDPIWGARLLRNCKD